MSISMLEYSIPPPFLSNCEIKYRLSEITVTFHFWGLIFLMKGNGFKSQQGDMFALMPQLLTNKNTRLNLLTHHLVLSVLHVPTEWKTNSQLCPACVCRNTQPPTPLPKEPDNSCTSKRFLLISQNCYTTPHDQAVFKRKWAALICLQSFSSRFLSMD